MAVRIRCINKSGGDHDNPHEAVSNYGWIDETDNDSGRSDRATMVVWVEKGNRAYVRDSQGEVDCKVNVSRAGTKFLQTYADGRWTDNLLSLQEC
ncbi:MAG: DUF3892 domain-containing protein [Candidatus Saccharimonadales bacterium]